MRSVMLITAICLFAVIAYSDLQSRRISNTLSLAIAVLGLLRIALAHDATAPQTLAAASITLAATFLLFWVGMIGGGDAKLIPATVLLVGSHGFVRFLLLMSFCGGVLALTILVRHNFRVGNWGRSERVCTSMGATIAERIAGSVDTVPYGVAIAAAGVISLVLEAPFAR